MPLTLALVLSAVADELAAVTSIDCRLYYVHVSGRGRGNARNEIEDFPRKRIQREGKVGSIFGSFYFKSMADGREDKKHLVTSVTQIEVADLSNNYWFTLRSKRWPFVLLNHAEGGSTADLRT